MNFAPNATFFTYFIGNVLYCRNRCALEIISLPPVIDDEIVGQLLVQGGLHAVPRFSRAAAELVREIS